MPWLYERRTCFQTIVFTLSELAYFPQQEAQMKRIVLLWEFHFLPSNSSAEFVVQAKFVAWKFVALTNILNSLD